MTKILHYPNKIWLKSNVCSLCNNKGTDDTELWFQSEEAHAPEANIPTLDYIIPKARMVIEETMQLSS